MKTNHLILLLTAIFLAACSKNDETPECNFQTPPESTRYFEFSHPGSGTTFYAWTTDTAVINLVLSQLALAENQRSMHINGKIAKMPEGCSLNKDWSWYFDPADWTLAELSIELCDGDPRFVEENVDEFVRTGRYCPWSSFVLREVGRPF